MQSWALSKGSIQKAGVLYIKIFACNFRLHSKVCIFIEFLPLLPRNVTKSHQHTREICRGLFNIWHDVPPWCSLASPAYSVVAFLCSVVVPQHHLSPLQCLLMMRFWQEFVVNCLFFEVHLHRPNQRRFPWHLHTNPKESFAYMHETVKHSNDHTFVAMDENLYDVVLQVELHHSCLCLSAEYSKRVYQGVRVKHTVKDLLAEKRSRQTSGPRYSVSTTVSPCFIFLYHAKRHSWRSHSDREVF